MAESTNQRAFDRIKQRLPCVICEGGTQYQGFVTDVSPSGLFLQTRAKLAAESQLIVHLDWDGQTITVTGDIARVRKSNRSAAAVNTAGFGFRLRSAPEAYFQLIVELQKPVEDARCR